MRSAEHFCKVLNRIFQKPIPSLNVPDQEYSQMELDWNLKSFHYFAPFVSLQDSRILEAGCGLGAGNVFIYERLRSGYRC